MAQHLCHHWVYCCDSGGCLCCACLARKTQSLNYLSTYLCIYLSIYQSVYLSINQSIYLSICLCTYLSHVGVLRTKKWNIFVAILCGIFGDGLRPNAIETTTLRLNCHKRLSQRHCAQTTGNGTLPRRCPCKNPSLQEEANTFRVVLWCGYPFHLCGLYDFGVLPEG